MNTENLQSIPKLRYYNQQLLKLEDFQREQDFHIAHRELQNKLIFIPGILSGLTIQKGAKQGQVQIKPGIAIDHLGRLINLTDSAKLNNADVSVQSGQFLLDLSNNQYYNKDWLLTLEYNQEEDSNNVSQWKEIPKFGLILSTNGARSTQIALATLNVTTSQTDATLSIDIGINLSIRVNAVLTPDRIPNIPASKIEGSLNIDQIPPLPLSKISGQFTAEQVPELNAEKIISGVLNLERIPKIPASKIEGRLDIGQIPTLQTSNISGQFSAEQVPELRAEKITSGVLNLERIPKIPASKIEGRLDIRQIPTLQTSNISGQFSAEQVPELRAEKITSGVLNLERIPKIPASKIEGRLDIGQIPPLPTSNILGQFSLDKPNINGEETVTLTWLSKLTDADRVVLEYVSENQIHQKELNGHPDQEQTYELRPYQTSIYTITAYKGDIIREQKQFIVQVIQNEYQLLKTFYYEGVGISEALETCFKRYNLLPLTNSSREALIDAAKKANYSEAEIINRIDSRSDGDLWAGRKNVSFWILLILIIVLLIIIPFCVRLALLSSV